MNNEALLDRLQVSYPLFTAGMGGVSGPRLVARVAELGCGGVLGCYKLFDEALIEILDQTEALTSKPYGVNFIQEVVGLDKLGRQISTVLEHTDENVYFTFFGCPDAAIIRRLKDEGRIVIVQVGQVDEAQKAVTAGADVLVVQGHDAGGHHLSKTDWTPLLEHCCKWWPETPVLVAGGIGSGRDMRRAQGQGALGVMCGTLFIAVEESDAHKRFKELVVASSPADTVITDTFHIGWPNRPHRVLNSPTVSGRRSLKASFIARTTINGVVYPIPRFSAAVPTNNVVGEVESMAMYCGTSCRSVSAIEPVAVVVDRFKREHATTTDF